MLARRKPAPAKSSILAYSAPAPMGGLNAVNGAASMPATDCIVLWNMIAAEYGLRARLGYREHMVGGPDIGGETPSVGIDGNPVRTVIPFTGSVAANSKLFAATSEGIFDVTTGGGTGTLKIAFPVTTGDAGYGVYHNVVTFAGHRLIYTDEVNGYYLYTETTDSWEKIKPSATVTWAAGQTIVEGDLRTDGVLHYIATSSGTTSGANIAADSVTWDQYLPLSPGTLGTLDPNDAVFCTVWKHRVWLIQRGTGKAFYLDLDAVYGVAEPFNFAGKFKAGGALRCMTSWTYDGGSGIDDRLVAVSDGGDVVIYEGTDPSIPGAFDLKGVWYVGGVPAGRNLFSEIGGDVLLLSKLGALPLSKLVIGNPIIDRSQYATAKIANLYSQLVSERGAYKGWAIRLHPEDGTLLINVPADDGSVSEQLAMSVTTRAWARYRYPKLTFVSAEAWNGKLYLGTTDGRIVVNDGYIDNVTIAAPESYDPVDFFVITSFQKLGSPRQKRVQIIRPTVTAQGTPPNYRVKAVYRYDLSEFTGGEAVTALAGAVFGVRDDLDTTDIGTSVFGERNDSDTADIGTTVFATTDYVSEQRVSGGTNGIGSEVAIAMAGRAAARTVLIGWDVMFDQGGFL